MSVPWACCSAPRAVSTITRSAPASRSASSRSSATGTPVTRSTRSGHQAATDRRTSSKPVVRVATYSSSTAPAASSRCSRPSASGEVGARHRLEEQVGALGGRRAPRVDDDDLAAALAEPVEVPGGRRHGLGEVGADQHEHVGLLDVGERERQPAVDPERPVAGRRRRRHAPAAVVVDLAGAERRRGRTCRAGRPSRWSAHRRRRRRPRPGRARACSAAQPRRPRGRAPRPRRGRAARRWRGRGPAGVVSRSRLPAQPGRRPALAAQRALVDRELRPRLHLQRAAIRRSRASCRTAGSSRGSGSVRHRVRSDPGPREAGRARRRCAGRRRTSRARRRRSSRRTRRTRPWSRSAGRRPTATRTRSGSGSRRSRPTAPITPERRGRLLGRHGQRGRALGRVRGRSPARPRSARSPGSSCTSTRCRCRSRRRCRGRSPGTTGTTTGSPVAIAGSAVGFGVSWMTVHSTASVKTIIAANAPSVTLAPPKRSASQPPKRTGQRSRCRRPRNA